MYCLSCQGSCRPRTCAPPTISLQRSVTPKLFLEVPCLLTAPTWCRVLIALEPRLRPHMLAMHHNSEPCTSNTWTTSLLRGEGATEDVDRLAAGTGDASRADVTWRLKSHSTGSSRTRPPLKCGHALPRPIRSCWCVAGLPPDILHDPLAH